MKKLILSLPILFICQMGFALSPPSLKPSRRAASGVDYTVNSSSWIPFSNATVSSTQSVTITTSGVGAFGIYGIFVSSPGQNSKIILYNHGSTSSLAGLGSEFAQFLTNTYGFIPMNVDVSTGGTNDGLSITITSAAAGSLAPQFLAPSLWFSFERKR